MFKLASFTRTLTIASRFRTSLIAANCKVFHSTLASKVTEAKLTPTMSDISEHVFENDQPVVLLDCIKPFNLLTSREKLYAHHISKASWLGSLITLFQVCTLHARIGIVVKFDQVVYD